MIKRQLSNEDISEVSPVVRSCQYGVINIQLNHHQQRKRRRLTFLNDKNTFLLNGSSVTVLTYDLPISMILIIG